MGMNLGMGIHETAFFASLRLRVRKSRVHASRVQRMRSHEEILLGPPSGGAA
jgi:hypothetical protein